jgi:D-xylulose reductase
MVLGHESSGTIVSVGSLVRTLRPGDPVAMEPGVPCRRCIRCKEGKYNLCPEMKFAATPPYHGTLARYYVLPEDFCCKLPEGVSLEEGALIEPLAVAVHITKQAGVRHGDSVVVFGAGPVGLLCCAVAREFGASKVIAVDIQVPRLEFAETFAATNSYVSQRVSAEENAKNLIQENNLGMGADVAIDASGVEPSVRTAIHVLRTGGAYVQGGMGKDEITFPIMAACTKELRVMGSFRYSSGDYKLAVELVAAGKIDVKRLISRQVKAGKGIKVLIGGSGESDGAVSPKDGIVAEAGVAAQVDGSAASVPVENGSIIKDKESVPEDDAPVGKESREPVVQEDAPVAKEGVQTVEDPAPVGKDSEPTVAKENGSVVQANGSTGQEDSGLIPVQ